MSLNDVFVSTQTVIPRDGVCQNLSFQSIFGENFYTRTLFPFRCFSIHVKMCVLLTFFYKMGLNYVQQRTKQQRKTSVITHERCANFRHRKKNSNGANLKLRHALRAGGVINYFLRFREQI